MGEWSLIAYAPAYNAAGTLPELLSRMARAADGLEKKHGVTLRSFIIVNDGSTDGTAVALSHAKSLYGWLETITKPKNEGPMRAIFDGMARVAERMEGLDAGKTLVVRMDSDLEHQPEDLPRLLAPILAGKARLGVGYIPFDKRSGEAAAEFNLRAGNEGSARFLGVEIPQFCPGFTAMRGDLFLELRPMLLGIAEEFRKETGKGMLTSDFVTLVLAKRLGAQPAAVRLSPIEDRMIKRPAQEKLAHYIGYHRITMAFLEKRFPPEAPG